MKKKLFNKIIQIAALNEFADWNRTRVAAEDAFENGGDWMTPLEGLVYDMRHFCRFDEMLEVDDALRSLRKIVKEEEAQAEFESRSDFEDVEYRVSCGDRRVFVNGYEAAIEEAKRLCRAEFGDSDGIVMRQRMVAGNLEILFDSPEKTIAVLIEEV
jgi:hypothetical protein